MFFLLPHPAQSGISVRETRDSMWSLFCGCKSSKHTFRLLAFCRACFFWKSHVGKNSRKAVISYSAYLLPFFLMHNQISCKYYLQCLKSLFLRVFFLPKHSLSLYIRNNAFRWNRFMPFCISKRLSFISAVCTFVSSWYNPLCVYLSPLWYLIMNVLIWHMSKYRTPGVCVHSIMQSPYKCHSISHSTF